MSVFNKEISSEKSTSDTIIGPSVRVEGNFVGEGNVIVEGELKGSIKTKQNLKVGENAKIEANINVDNALVSGEVRGNIKVKEKLQLTKTARILGDVEAKILSVVEGAVLNGKCNMGNVEEKPADRNEKMEKAASKSVKNK